MVKQRASPGGAGDRAETLREVTGVATRLVKLETARHYSCRCQMCHLIYNLLPRMYVGDRHRHHVRRRRRRRHDIPREIVRVLRHSEPRQLYVGSYLQVFT